MFMNDLSIIVRHMRVFAERSLKDYSLGFPEQIVIMYLTKHGRSNQQKIAESFGIDQGAITKTINKLEAKGFVDRKVNPKNKREKILSLTSKATTLQNELNRTYQEWSSAIFKDIPQTQRKAFEETVHSMANNSITLMNEDN